MTKSEFLDFAKAELVRSNQDRKHPFRLMTLATHAKYPAIRTIVKRDFNPKEWTMLAYSDIRTFKISELSNNPLCSLHFYHPKKQLQLVLNANAEMITSGYDFDTHKEKASINAKDYTTQLSPGTPISDSSYSFSKEVNFCLLKFNVVRVNLLQLGRIQHLRACFDFIENPGGTWLVP